MAPPIMTARRPRSTTACSSSASASSGVNVGMQATGIESVGVGGVLLCEVGVERGRHGLAQLLVGDVDGDESVGGVQHGNVETKLIEALVEQAREHGSRPVEGIAGGDAPPGRLGDAVAFAHLVADSLERLTAVHEGIEALRHRLVGQIDQQVPYEGEELDQVSVAVDDGMLELGPDVPEPRPTVRSWSSPRSLPRLGDPTTGRRRIQPVAVPDRAAFDRLCGSSKFSFGQRVSSTRRHPDSASRQRLHRQSS